MFNLTLADGKKAVQSNSVRGTFFTALGGVIYVVGTSVKNHTGIDWSELIGGTLIMVGLGFRWYGERASRGRLETGLKNIHDSNLELIRLSKESNLDQTMIAKRQEIAEKICDLKDAINKE